MSSRRRIGRFGFTAFLMSTAACSAIAGLDGEYELGTLDSGTVNNPDGNTSGTDGNTSGTVPDGQTTTDAQPKPDDSGSGMDAGTDSPTCSFPTDASDPNSITAPNSICPVNGWVLCWDFAPSYSAPDWGWNGHSATAEGSSYEVTDASVGSAARNLHVVIADAGSAGKSQSLFINDWDSPGGTQPFNFFNNSAILIAVSFNLKRADRPANILTFGFRNAEIGFAVYPNPCGGPARVGPVGQNPASYPGGANVLLDHWYRAEVKLTRLNDHWTAAYAVSGVAIGTSTDPFPVDPSTALDASITTGLFKIGNGGTDEISLDDVLITVVSP